MAGDTDSPDRVEGGQEVLEVQRGESFFLFPEDKPIGYQKPDGTISEVPTLDIDSLRIHVQGIEGVFGTNFSNMSLMPDELDEIIKSGARVVLVTNDGPIDLVEGTLNDITAARLEKDKYTQLITWSLPDSITQESGVQIALSTPRFTARYMPNSYNDEDDTKDYLFAVDEDGREIQTLIFPIDPGFLRKIRVEISQDLRT